MCGWGASSPATSVKVVYDDGHVIHNIKLTAANSSTISFSSTKSICAAFSDSALR